jgi:hypothetical protein
MFVRAKDISQYQGTFKNTGEPIVMIKMSGGDAGLYMDPQATNNYEVTKKLGKAVGGYHFAGGTDPIKEADYFIKAMSPIAENDVFCLDWEVQHANPVDWCLQFVNEVHSKTSVWPLLYINASTCNSYDWSPVLKNCGLWIADYAVSPEANVPVKHTYVMHQYTDKPYDQDAWFGTVEEFKAYGYHAPKPKPTPIQAPKPTTKPAQPPTPAPPQPPQPQTAPPVPPEVNQPQTPKTDNQTPGQTQPPQVAPKKVNWLIQLVDKILRFFDVKV